MKTTTKTLALAALVATVGGCFSERSTEPEDTTPCDGTTSACDVSVVDDSFSPRRQHVLVGSTVRWTNNGESFHTSTGDDWDSGTLTTDEAFEHTFDATGEFDYVCVFHDGMRGTIIVEE